MTTFAGRLAQHWTWRRRRLRVARRSLVLGPWTPRRTLWLCSWQRSGSTWLAEMLSRAPGTRLVYEPANEPDHLYTGEDAARTALPTQAGPVSRFILGALAGYGHSAWLDQLNRATLARRSVVKDVRAMGVAGDVADGTVAAVVLLLRHPFAVARSVVDLGWTEPSLAPADAFLSEVTSWCDLHARAARDERLRQAYVVAYEDLVADTPRELEALTAWLSARHRTWRVLRDTPLDAAKRSATNFRGTASATDHFDDLDPAWRAAGLTVLERFGLTGLYGAEPGVAANWRDEWARLGAVTSWN